MSELDRLTLSASSFPPLSLNLGGISPPALGEPAAFIGVRLLNCRILEVFYQSLLPSRISLRIPPTSSNPLMSKDSATQGAMAMFAIVGRCLLGLNSSNNTIKRC